MTFLPLFHNIDVKNIDCHYDFQIAWRFRNVVIGIPTFCSVSCEFWPAYCSVLFRRLQHRIPIPCPPDVWHHSTHHPQTAWLGKLEAALAQLRKLW